DDDQVHGVVSNETDLRLWIIRDARVCRLNSKWTVCGLFEARSQSRLRANAVADLECRHVRGRRAVSAHGAARGNARTHVSRVTGKDHLRRARTLGFQGRLTYVRNYRLGQSRFTHAAPGGRARTTPCDV